MESYPHCSIDCGGIAVRARVDPLTTGIRYYSLLDGSGYGDAAFSYMEGLIHYGIPVKWSPIIVTSLGMFPWEMIPDKARPVLGNGAPRRQKLLATMDTASEYDTVILHCMPELFAKISTPGKVRIGYTVWEADTLPSHWPPLLTSVDKLLVPCLFNQPMFTFKEGPEVTVLPHIADSAYINPNAESAALFRQQYQIRAETFVFYNISAWDPRKAVWETLHAYLLAFNKTDDVCLILKTEKLGHDYSKKNISSRVAVKQLVQNIVDAYPDPPRVILIDEYIEENEVIALHQASDCYFSLTHAEGWGMGAFHAGASGNAVICTGWGGQLDFLNKQYAYLVGFKLTSVKSYRGRESYQAHQKWAEADIDHAIALLQYAHLHPEESRSRGAGLGKFIRKKFSSEKITEQLISVIDG